MKVNFACLVAAANGIGSAWQRTVAVDCFLYSAPQLSESPAGVGL